MKTPETHYATTTDGIRVAYQVIGTGARTILWIPGFVSNIEILWNEPAFTHWVERLATLGRVVIFDKRGTGLSDPFTGVPTLDERIDDVEAVLDAVGCDQTVIYGISEGGPMAALFAATHPERVSHLVLYGSMPCGPSADSGLPPEIWAGWGGVINAVRTAWGTGETIRWFAPSVADRPLEKRRWATLERFGASPQMALQIVELLRDIDVRAVLGSITAPTLVAHQRRDAAVPVEAAELFARLIPGAELVVAEGVDHIPFREDDQRLLFGHLSRFVVGSQPQPTQRRLSTVLFTDIVESTARAAADGDAAWAATVASHDDLMRSLLDEYEGEEVKTLGDGFLATFDGPTRAVACALALAEQAPALGIEVRAGAHTGEVDVSVDDVKGLTVNIASRVCDLASAGEVLVTRTVQDLAGGAPLTFTSTGSHNLKGVPQPWEVSRVEASGSRSLEPLPSRTPATRASDRLVDALATRTPRLGRTVAHALRRLPAR